MPPADPLLVILTGPTGSGKTALSLALAGDFGGEIVNCDSVAVYRQLHIGTAKPTAGERARVPHHLFDILEPAEVTTAGEYARRARQALHEIRSRARLPIVAGGTGLYLRALLEGLFPGPQRSEALRTRLRERAGRRGSGYLHRLLRRLDSAAAARIHSNDENKLIRALEVCLAARRPMTDQWAAGREPLTGFRSLRLVLDPPRAQLYARLDRRAEAMFAAGLLEETRGLLAQYGPAIWPLGAHGYRQAVQHIHGELDLPQAIAATRQAHRNYAKRQLTFFRMMFRSEPQVHWMAGFGDDPRVREEAAQRLRHALAASS